MTSSYMVVFFVLMIRNSMSVYGHLQGPHMDGDKRENRFMGITKTIARNLNDWMSSSRVGLDNVKKVASRSGVGYGTLQRAAKGEGNTTAENIAAIAEAFGRKPHELLMESPERDPLSGLDASERQLVTDYRELLREDREAFLSAIHKEANKARAYRSGRSSAEDTQTDSGHTKGVVDLEWMTPSDDMNHFTAGKKITGNDAG